MRRITWAWALVVCVIGMMIQVESKTTNLSRGLSSHKPSRTPESSPSLPARGQPSKPPLLRGTDTHRKSSRKVSSPATLKSTEPSTDLSGLNETLQDEGSTVPSLQLGGRAWHFLDDSDDDNDDNDGLFAQLSTYVKKYTIQEGLGMLDDHDIRCLLTLNSLLSESSNHGSLMAPVATLSNLILKMSTMCKLRLIAKGRMFLSQEFVRGILQILMTRKKKQASNESSLEVS